MTGAHEETKAYAPGKLILSGEHSVLYGAPAVAMAIARYTEVSFRPQGLGEGLKTAFENLTKSQRYGFLARIQVAKKAETRQKRLRETMDMLAAGTAHRPYWTSKAGKYVALLRGINVSGQKIIKMAELKDRLGDAAV